MKNIGSMVRPSQCVVIALLLLAGCASHAPAPVVGRDGQPSAVQVASSARDVYTVKSGDTLYSIARDHGMDHRELIAMNGIENPNHITVGRVLKIRPQGGATTAPVTSAVVVAQPIAAEQSIEKRPLASGPNTDTFKREPKAGKEPYSDLALAQAQGQKPDAAKAPESPAIAARPDNPPEAKPADTPPALTGDEIAWIWPANGKTIGTFSESGSKGLDLAGKAGDPVIAAADGKVVYSGTGLRGYG